MPERLEESEQLVAKIVGSLASNGVSKTVLSPTDFFCEPSKENSDLLADAIDWLGQEGIIRHGESIEDIDHGFLHFYDCVLTSYGFKVLERDYDGAGTKLATAIRSTNEAGTGFSNVGELFGGLLGAFTKSIGNG